MRRTIEELELHKAHLEYKQKIKIIQKIRSHRAEQLWDNRKLLRGKSGDFKLDAGMMPKRNGLVFPDLNIGNVIGAGMAAVIGAQWGTAGILLTPLASFIVSYGLMFFIANRK